MKSKIFINYVNFWVHTCIILVKAYLSPNIQSCSNYRQMKPWPAEVHRCPYFGLPLSSPALIIPLLAIPAPHLFCLLCFSRKLLIKSLALVEGLVDYTLLGRVSVNSWCTRHLQFKTFGLCPIFRYFEHEWTSGGGGQQRTPRLFTKLSCLEEVGLKAT